MDQKTYITTKPATLTGFQAIFEVNKNKKHTLKAVIDSEHIEALTAERAEMLKTTKKQLCHHRAVERFEPWEEIASDRYQVWFNWDEEAVVPIVDSIGKEIVEPIPLCSGSKVRLIFVQSPYALGKDEKTGKADACGTALKLRGIQVVKCFDMALAAQPKPQEVADMFGVVQGGYTYPGAK